MNMRTPLYQQHLALGAKMVPFAGFDMPVAYPAGMTAEHRAVRERCGVFDVSHMGEFEVTGPDAVAFTDFVTSNSVRRLAVGQVQYSTILNDRGTIVDDCLVYRLADRVMMVVNASNRDKDLAHVRSYVADFDCAVSDISDRIALLAVQGPLASEVLRPLTSAPLDEIKYYHFMQADVSGIPVILSRTGYTGEDGFELYFDGSRAPELWALILANPNVSPAGLGARDSLRLEAGLPLYGNDIDDTTSPLEANLSFVTKLDKARFVGKDSLVDVPPRRKLVGFRIDDRTIPRHGYPVKHASGAVDCVRSGAQSPTLGFGIGTTYLPVAVARVGEPLVVDIRGRDVNATVVKMPFYRTTHPPKR